MDHRIHPPKVHDSVVFGIDTELCNHHHCQFQDIFKWHLLKQERVLDQTELNTPPYSNGKKPQQHIWRLFLTKMINNIDNKLRGTLKHHRGLITSPFPSQQ